MPEKLYRLEAEIPEIGGLPGDYVVVRPGRPEPLSLVRKLPAYQLAHVLPHLEELEILPKRIGPTDAGSGLRLVK